MADEDDLGSFGRPDAPAPTLPPPGPREPSRSALWARRQGTAALGVVRRHRLATAAAGLAVVAAVVAAGVVVRALAPRGDPPALVATTYFTADGNDDGPTLARLVHPQAGLDAVAISTAALQVEENAPEGVYVMSVRRHGDTAVVHVGFGLRGLNEVGTLVLRQLPHGVLRVPRWELVALPTLDVAAPRGVRAVLVDGIRAAVHDGHAVVGVPPGLATIARADGSHRSQAEVVDGALGVTVG